MLAFVVIYVAGSSQRQTKVDLDAKNLKTASKIVLCSLYVATIMVTMSHSTLKTESPVSCSANISNNLYAYSK